MTELEEYDYNLPRELIAQEPLEKRIDARLMVVRREEGLIEHAYVRDLPAILRSGDGLVLNDTRVVKARLSGFRAHTGGRWDGLFLSTDDKGLWKVLGRTRGTLVPGETINLVDRKARERARLRMLANLGDGIWAARAEPNGEIFLDAYSLLEAVGRVPIPPYIRGGMVLEMDQRRYQTVFAKKPGSVAAPTAGLHFNFDLLRQIQEDGVDLFRITLHVGVGTFRPITAKQLDDHEMHPEWCSIDAEDARQLVERRKQGGRIVAVGSTSVRALETAAADGELKAWSGETNLFIRPPYQFRAVDALMTNFHLPRSTLLVMVRTFGGDKLIREAYEQAIRAQYRFYSYGDAMLIL